MTRPWRIGIAGTGTDVGKTHLGVQLAARLLQTGLRVLALKPVETGYGDASRSDAARLALGAGHALEVPWFTAPEPVAPMRAAALRSETLELAGAADWVAQLESRYEPQVTLIEGAGGLFSPLNEVETNLDLLRRLQVDAWLLIAGHRLGVLHDVLAAVSAARRVWCLPTAVIVNDPAGGAAENVVDLRRCGVRSAVETPTTEEAFAKVLGQVLAGRSAVG